MGVSWQFAGGFDSEANDLFADLHAVLSPPQEQEEEHDEDERSPYP